MGSIDINCLVGHWPFRKITKNSFEELKKVHGANGISSGYIASLNSIFYNDPFEGDEELHEAIKGSGYKHILTINPTLPCIDQDIENGISRFDIKGVRIYPGYHGYSLGDDCVKELCKILSKHGLPLFIALRMEDERLNHIFQPRALTSSEIRAFLESNPGVKTVLLTIRMGEIESIKDLLHSRKNLFVDTSGLKDQIFNVDKLVAEYSSSKILFGSLHPLYCLKSSLIQVEKAYIEETDKNNILGKNAGQL